MTDRSTPQHRTTKLHSLHNYGSSRPSSTKTTNASPNLSEPSSRTNRIRTVEARAVLLEMCIDRSSETMS